MHAAQRVAQASTTLASLPAPLRLPRLEIVCCFKPWLSSVTSTALSVQVPAPVQAPAQVASTAAAATAASPNLVGLGVVGVAAVATIGLAARQQGAAPAPASGDAPAVGSSSSNGASPPGKSPQAAEARAWIEAWRAKQN